MSNSTPAAAVAERPETGPAPEKEKPHRRGPGPRLAGGSPAARRQAAAILEVLAGMRSPAEAASALGVSTPRYYALELQALAGLLAACEKRARGPRASPEKELTRLRQEQQRLEGELGRLRALARAAQRTVGLAPPPPPEPRAGQRRRRRQVRALKLAERLQVPPAAPPGGEGVAAEEGSAGAGG